MKVVILAGGKGSRLGLKDIPKPLLEVGNIPVIKRQVLEAKKYGLIEFIFLTGYRADKIFDYFKNGEELGIKITHINGPYLLGTGGSLKLLEYLLTDDFFVFYGDTVFDINLSAFIKFHKEFQSIGSLLSHPNDHPYDSDLLITDSNDQTKLQNIISGINLDNQYYNNLVNAGMYILSPKIFNYIKTGEKLDICKDIFPMILKKKGTLRCYRSTEYIKDVGTFNRVQLVEKDLKNGKVTKLNKKNIQKAIFLDRDGVINKYVKDLSKIKDFDLCEKSIEGIRLFNRSEYLVIVVTNQPMISKGYMSLDTLDMIHKKMETLLGRAGAYIDGLYFCPHHPDSGFEGEVRQLKQKCYCRKPHPGMLFQAAKDFNIDLSVSWIIGDHKRDIICGINAKVSPILIGETNILIDKKIIPSKKNLFEAASYILNKNNQQREVTI